MKVWWVIVLWLAGVGFSHAARLRIEGVAEAEWRRIRERMSGKLQLILERPATPWRADDAAYLVRSELLADGYDGVRVESRIEVASDTIVLKAVGGRRLVVGQVTVKGIEDPVHQGRMSELLTLPVKQGRGLVADAPYVVSKISEGERLAEQYLKSLGYWDAKAGVRVAGRDAGKVDLELHAETGVLYRIARPRWTGDLKEGRGEIDGVIDDLLGRPATTKNLNAMRSRVERWYARRGFTLAEIRFSAEPEQGGRLATAFEVISGKQYTTRSVKVLGFEKTKPERVGDFYRDLEGSEYDSAAFDTLDKAMLRTGAFRDVRRSVALTDEGLADVEVTFEEGKARGVSFTVGAGAFERFIIGMGYYDRNLMGNLWTAAYNFEFTGRGLLGEARFVNPLFFDTRTSLNGKVTAITRNHEGYSVARGGVDGYVERRFGDHQWLRLGYLGARVTSQEDGLPTNLLGLTDYTDTRVYARYVLDRRDDAVAPMQGYYVSGQIGAGSILDGDVIPYTRGQVDAAIYKTIDERDTFVARVSAGVIESGGKEMPIDERYFLGGADTVRSFQQRELGPFGGTGDDPIGARQYWYASTEYLRTVAGPLRVVTFFDIGSLGDGSDGPGGGEVEMAVGAGLRLNLPIGPIRFEYGYSLTRDDPEPAGAFQFAIGLNF